MKRLYYIPSHSPACRAGHYYSCREDGSEMFFVMRSTPHFSIASEEGMCDLRHYKQIARCQLEKNWPVSVIKERQ